MSKNNSGYHLQKRLNYHIRRRGGALLCAFFFILGVFCGTRVWVRLGSKDLQLLQALLEPGELSLRNSFLRHFLPEVLQLGLLFFCGFCAIGQPAAAFLLFYRGLGLGLIGTVAAAGGESSFLNYATLQLPPSLLFLLIQMAASREAVAFSMNFLRHLLGSSSRTLTVTPRVYILRFLLLLFLCGIVAIGGTVLTELL